MCVVFEVNKLDWEVSLKDQVEIKKRVCDTSDDVYLGITVKELNQVWLWNEIEKNITLYRTIKHELTHVFIESYGFGQFGSFSEENMADFIECYADEIVDLAQRIFIKLKGIDDVH